MRHAHRIWAHAAASAFAAALLALGPARPATAQPAAPPAAVRIASAFDPQTLDPHALALLYHSRVVFQIYDSLIGRNESFKRAYDSMVAFRGETLLWLISDDNFNPLQRNILLLFELAP